MDCHSANELVNQQSHINSVQEDAEWFPTFHSLT